MFGQQSVTKGVGIAGVFLGSALLQSVSAQSASSFKLGDVQLLDSRWSENQERTLNYLLFVDSDRLLYNFRANHGLDNQSAEANGGWDAPDFPFRTHSQGHFLTAWAQCWAVLGNEECRDRATYFVAELAKCQANNEAAGYTTGYLSGFPESDFEKVENRTLDNGNVPYYAVHKTMAGLLDVWRYIEDEAAMDVLTGMAGWVDERTSQLTEEQIQEMLETEYGGMNDILAQLSIETGNEQWLTVAQRFDHAATFDFLANNNDQLNGLHANTQVAKWIGVINEFHATGESRYSDIAHNAYDFVVGDHSYAIGGNSQSEHFREPGAIAEYLDNDTCEACNTYNMLKVTRELWALDPESSHYFDFYERASLNHLLGAQDSRSDHGHITYFTPLNPGGRRGVGPAWGGGTWSTDYDSFWCCQSTQIETNTKLMDSIYWHTEDTTLYVNLYIPSQLNWADKNIKITQTTDMPASDTATFEVEGSGSFDLFLRIPDWTTSDAQVVINGESVGDITVEPGTYAIIRNREWADGDSITVTLPMTVRSIPAPDDENVAAIAFGPTILAANYGDTEFDSLPQIDLDSVQRVGTEGLSFEAQANGETVSLGPFYNAHGYNYNVYWRTA